MNTINITVPQAVEVPLEPIVEAVRQALVTDPEAEQDAVSLVYQNILDGGVIASALDSAIDLYDFTMTVEEAVNSLGCVTDLSDHASDIEDIVEQWFGYNFSIDNYSDDVQCIAEAVLSDRGWDNLDPSEFPTIESVNALTARISELESRVERLVSALQNAVRAYSVDGGAQ